MYMYYTMGFSVTGDHGRIASVRRGPTLTEGSGAYYMYSLIPLTILVPCLFEERHLHSLQFNGMLIIEQAVLLLRLN